MEMLLKIWVVIISFISIVPLFLIAQNSPKDYLKAHNDERVKVGAKPLKWDPQLASLARKFVKKHIFDCKKGIFDTTFAGNTYGQSNAYNLGSRSGVDAVNAWLLQKINYDYKSNTCIDGNNPRDMNNNVNLEENVPHIVRCDQNADDVLDKIRVNQ
ncbi:pathogenesis-related protein 1-like [Arachis ipaensis]|uniref:pathogenesis-related protein 1-like n=1 Tax=Arachis ipaensis TaxID=130454 RepID=UPI000A2B3B0E|nr:pathogenesis-related protein 1-like [Arachis ipaensis]